MNKNSFAFLFKVKLKYLQQIEKEFKQNNPLTKSNTMRRISGVS